jgi:CubicO group peptidase (beta-lactamase class C family)
MKNARIVAAWLALGAQALPLSAAGAGPRDFTSSLKRSVAIEGREEERFRLEDRMAHYLVPGVSVAVIDKCRIVHARGFGRAAPGGRPVTARTIFQAGSISKTFTAVAALRLVERGALGLDRDVRQALKSWRLPQSPLLKGRNITLRMLLSHSAGINQEGGNGYSRDEPLPSLREILDGRPPANTAPIRVESAPGSRWRYSGGGYYITQSLMQDTTGSSYPKIMDQLVFKPLRLRDSSFSQPLERRRIPFAARATGPDGSALDGGWRVNPELAAGGLWSTPSDIARLLIAVARGVRGEGRTLLSPAMASQLMTRGLGDWGLGVSLGPPEKARRFGHTGHNVGFVSEYVMYPDSCRGAVVMTNADQGGWLATEILRAIGDAYDWPDREPLPVQAAVPLTDTIAKRFVGTYRLKDFPAERFVISRRPNGLYWARVGHVGRDLLPGSDTRLFSPDSMMTLEVADPKPASARTLSLSFGGGQNLAERIN